MKLLENDLLQGSKNISKIAGILNLPKRTILTAKAIFFYVYPKLSLPLTDITFNSVYIASKIEETHIKIDTLIAAAKEYKIKKPTFIKCESKIVEALGFNFEINHVHFIFLKICKLLNKNIEFVKVGWAILDEIHDGSTINQIKYFEEGEYEPQIVALSMFNDVDIRMIEEELFIDIDRKAIINVRKAFVIKLGH